MGQQGAVWTRTEGQRKLKDSGGGLFPAVEGHSLEQNRIEQANSTLNPNPHSSSGLCCSFLVAQ